MSQININKLKKYENGVTFEFRYEGNSTPVFDEEKAERLIEKFLSNEKKVSVMSRNISYIRTILKDTDEKLLVIKYNDGKNVETVKYDNKVLFLFECKEYNDESSNYMEVSFTPGRGLKVSFSDLENDCITDYPQSKTIKDKFNQIIEHIEDLKNAGFVYLDNDSKLLIEIYKLFYNENPDFSKEDINIKIQTMMLILAQFDICYGDYTFDFYEKMPESLTIFQKVYNLFPLGEITIVDNPLELKASAKKYIKIVGETIRDTLGNEENLNEALITISKAIYAGRFDLTYYSNNIKELTEYPNINLTVGEAKSSLKLVKKIKDRIFENM